MWPCSKCSSFTQSRAHSPRRTTDPRNHFFIFSHLISIFLTLFSFRYTIYFFFFVFFSLKPFYCSCIFRRISSEQCDVQLLLTKQHANRIRATNFASCHPYATRITRETMRSLGFAEYLAICWCLCQCLLYHGKH